MLPLVHIRTGRAAGKLSVGFWDHWVPAGNEVMKKQCAAWGAKNQVEVQPDFITSNGSKNIMTQAAEAQAKTGHDIQQFPGWETQNHADQLEPVDDVMKRLTAKYGPVTKAAEYLFTKKKSWVAVPCSSGNQNKGPCGRISVLKEVAGLDIVKMYPASAPATAEADKWTYDAMLKAAEACKKANMTFGIGLGTTPDSVDTAGSLFAAFGAHVITEEGGVDVRSDPVRQALEYAQQLVKYLPDDAVSFDDASNNRALISGKSALIWNPPSAWAVAKRDAPQVAADSWTFPAPKGPKGRYLPLGAFSWGIWNFSPNKTAAKELIEFLSQRENVEERCNATVGYDVPPFASMTDFKIWDEVEPPKGTVYHYPIRPSHHQENWIAMAPAPPEIAVQAYNRGTLPTMLAKLKSGQSIKQVQDWAEDELSGFTR
ncbi:MAG TPA: extracellular solute-binding protein [Rhodopila sp.]|uniref:ABC transporter substrate-binding protein n=1 Tax=Rhodopila sp. TaxID=2480087 RepID=UPI002C9872EA|nr:extracellular solute-binding protein [Rhodopila sp.]HVY14272.1 extracellular solute-binding protein [Rhodopila sp.]